MSRWRVLVLVLSLAACTKPNPRSCADGTCTDPAFPFCDVGGELEGTPQTCIAVACEPGEFNGCRGDLAITCNTEGSDFDLIECERGCDDGVGCRLCEPNETACTNGTVATCDAAGAVTAMESCPLGCFENEPRCREIDPSNNLRTFLDMVVEPPDIDGDNIVFNTTAATVKIGATEIEVPNFLVPASGNGSAIRLFVVGSARINSATITDGADERFPASPAFALIARRDIQLRGEILVSPRIGAAVAGCSPGDGFVFRDQDDRIVSSGGGGGGNATGGAAGGAISGIVNPVPGGVGDGTSGTPALVPLRGGCSGSLFDLAPDYANGGGAVQLTSRTAIDVDATIDFQGGPGTAELGGTTTVTTDLFGGGGAGGSLLLEAPSVTLGTHAKLLGAGGKGFSCPTPTGTCTAGGTGATVSSPASPGVGIQQPGSVSVAGRVVTGGGGGGLGRVRINTEDETFTTSSAVTIEADLTTGEVRTR